MEIWIDDQPTRLARAASEILLAAQTTLATDSGTDTGALLVAMESLEIDATASLALDATDGRFWLLDLCGMGAAETILRQLEALVNQRDTLQRFFGR